MIIDTLEVINIHVARAVGIQAVQAASIYIVKAARMMPNQLKNWEKCRNNYISYQTLSLKYWSSGDWVRHMVEMNYNI